MSARRIRTGSGAASPAGRTGPRRALALALASVAVTAGAVLGLAAPASAHNYMIASTPTVNGTLTSLPKRFEITTNDRLLDIGDTNSGFAYRIVGPSGRYYENGCLIVDGPSMTTKAALGRSGEYTIEWQIVSADGHTVSDRYRFRWEAPAGFRPATGSTRPPVCASGPGSSAAASDSGTGSAGSGSSGVVGDAIWIGAGGLVLVALVVVVLLLLRRPAGSAVEPATAERGRDDEDDLADDARD
ncbi:copper resistance CopC family protein [Curtobacterium sp. MCBD17_028]|uniref:copper resistance CopC family protein n=1 Tax=Curtobacterium sp. MCBD17_028 TaxID=2175670 RepID=UPI000DA9F9D9|nr:copper resistance CopC family protein [Curtobacterium sp. MCBD17_028]PZE23998.1 copper resistance protein CopC [Curtobacterium sp. MCBD17_028]